ncbi:MAG: capsule assembly Wzi family protein, partial [Ignavibacteriales bacterium]
AQNLISASENTNGMTSLEKDELAFYSREYSYEIKQVRRERIPASLSYLGSAGNDRFRFFSYSDSAFAFFADPVLAYDISMRSGEKVVKRSNGAKAYGYFNGLGFSLDIRDNVENGSFIDTSRSFTAGTGFNFKSKRKNYINYDDVCAALTYSWNWGNISVAKDYMNWGSGMAGQIILSDKAPSFPMLRLNIHPFPWMDFTYIHGYLNSGVMDSSTLRINTNPKRLHYELIEKFYVAHMLTLKPFRNLALSIGESVVYSDRFEPVYLIPFIFFRMADHYLNYSNATAGNAQIFGDISWKVPVLRSKFYSSLFIDEFSFENLTGDKYPSAVAYTFGWQAVNPLINDCELNIEYTRINPFVYFHADDAQGYSNYNYQMGHWIGSNGDQLHVSFTKYIMRGLKAGVWAEFVRKGEKESRKEARYQKYQTFLFGLRTNYTWFGFDASCEIIHSLTARVSYRSASVSREQNDGSFIPVKTSDFVFGVGYGL